MAGSTTLVLTALSILLTCLPSSARPVGDLLARAPGLDLMISLYTWIPWVVGIATTGKWGLFGALAGEVATYFIWVGFHERRNPRAMSGPRLVKVINRTVGRWQNHAALWGTIIVAPALWHFRLIEVLVYPFLVKVLKLPAYDHGEWVNVSRYKFDGLVGHDLFWCLYCDWMTGVTSLGVEMLRNVESFWCPIRFYEGKKCENCKIDFPDIDRGWVAAEGTMLDVEAAWEKMYGHGERSWFGHPARLTVRGKPPEQPAGQRQ